MRLTHGHQGFASAQKTDDFDSIWTVLSSSLTEINTKNASALSFEELYRNAYKIVLMMRGEELYEKVKTLEQEWLQNEVQKRITGSISSSLIRSHKSVDVQDPASERRAAGEKFLAVLKGAWEDHQLCMGMITDVLMYMVRQDNVGDVYVLLTVDHRTGSSLETTRNPRSMSQPWRCSATMCSEPLCPLIPRRTSQTCSSPPFYL